jgi:hypothetical protein
MAEQVTVTGVNKQNGNTELVSAEGHGTSWGTIKFIEWYAPEGKCRVGQRVRIEQIKGSNGYGAEYEV